MKNKQSLLLKIFFILMLMIFINFSYIKDLIRPGFKEKIFSQINYDQNIPIKDRYKIAIDVRSIPYLQNKQIASRIKLAAKKLGWEAHIIDIVDFFGSDERAKKLKKIAPDFMIIIGYNEDFLNEDKNFSYMNFEETEFNKYIFLSNPPFAKVSLINKYFINPSYLDFLYKFDGFLYSFDNASVLEQYIKLNDNKFNGMNFLPYVDQIKIPVNIDKFAKPILYYSANNYKYDIEFYHNFDLVKILDQQSSIDFYGVYQNLPSLENNWKGQEPYDGNELLNLMSKYAGVIILSDQKNSYFYIKPTLETIASGNLIITTHNKFTDKYFKDVALFVANGSAEKMAGEILQHQEWIKNNPDKALAMVNKSQEIMLKNFKTIDQQLKSLAIMHSNIILKNKN